MASKKTRFAPVYFEIYDQSTTEHCDRLIVVKPFNYYILAKNGEVWVLDSEMTECEAHEMSVSLAPFTDHGAWFNTCSTTNLSSIVDGYQINAPVTVTVNIDKGTFTVIDALNLLLKKYIEIRHTGPTVVEDHIVA